MGRNLISVKELEHTGFTNALGDGVIKVFKGALRDFKAARRNGIYIMQAEVMGGLNFTITNTGHLLKSTNM